MRIGIAVALWVFVTANAVLAAADPTEPAGLAPLQPATLMADEEAIQNVANRNPGLLGCPQWTDYFVFDALFLQRGNSAIDRPLAEGSSVSPDPGATLLSTRDMQFPVAPGLRLLYGQRNADHTGWEVGYLGVYGMWADANVGGVNQIAMPGAIAGVVPGWQTADSVQATYSSALNIVEGNLLCWNCCEGCTSGDDRYCRCTDLMVGAFWAGLEEQASLNVTCCEGDPPTPYRAQSSSNLIGSQIGIRRRTDWRRFALEGTAKAGIAGNVLSQSSGPITSTLAPGAIFREPTSASAGSVGLLSMMNLTAIYRLTDHWGLRAGYNLIWLEGLALAPNQWDFTNTASSGESLVGGGGLFLHGANLGVERRW
jgi:hypothetical protein